MGSKRDTIEPVPTEGGPPEVPQQLRKKPRSQGTIDGSTTVKSAMPRSIGITVESSASQPQSTAPQQLGESPAKLKTFCQHDVSLPGNYPQEYDISALKLPEKPAKEYNFSLDAFQRESVKCLERDESVLVAAHTSAGKTVVAEYAIALALRKNQRVIYTSPIKALSNQKYRELQEQFTDVGLMTGDVTIDKNASCLVMTTEILRSMLYKGSEVIREIAWVIFDEVHYMRDKERGVVWEETIILVPQNVKFVFLSATIPNAREFSEWIAHLKNQPCHTIYTNTRPVPLQHYLFPSGADGFHLVVGDTGQFRMESFERAMSELGKNRDREKSGAGSLRKGKGRGPNAQGKSDCFKAVKLIKEQNFLPVIVFSFSRRDCEALAMQLSKIDLNDATEKTLVQDIFTNAIGTLNEEDQNLQQVTAILPLLERGIGIHHSGLLPIIKEVVELLFQESLIKCLFATETFSMGLNMPAKTVLFTSIRKFDGTQFRHLLGGEYIQMSGRAGRRGLDSRGIAILMTDENVEPDNAKTIMSGASEPLRSTFKLGYNMLLNLLRAEEADPEYVIARSLAQFQEDKALPQNQAKLAALEQKKSSMKLGGRDVGAEDHEVRSYFKMRQIAEKLKGEVRDIIHQPSHVTPFLQEGRVVRIRSDTSADLGNTKTDVDYGWGAVVKYTKKSAGTKRPEEERFVVDVLLRCVAGSNRGHRPRPYRPPPQSEKSTGNQGNKPNRKNTEEPEWMVVSCSFKELFGLSALRVHKKPDLRPVENRLSVGRSVMEVLRRYPDGPPMLDPFSDMGITDEKLAILLKKVEAVEEAMLASPVAKSPQIAVLMKRWRARVEVEKEVKAMKRELDKAKGILFKEELKRMKRVLRRLGFTNNDDVVEVKGRVACEVNTADELVITELLLGGNLNEMTPEVLVALCSCFVLDEGKRDENLKLEKELQVAFDSLRAIATRVGTVTKQSNIPIDVDSYVESFSPDGMRVVYHWCKGMPFGEVTGLSNLFEGTVIRCLRRLEELLRQLIAAVKSIGNTELEEKFQAGSTALKRGIAFHSSLYV